MNISIRYKSTRKYSFACAHDFRIGPQPNYVNSDLTHLNKTLIQPPEDFDAVIADIEKKAVEVGKRKWQKNSPYFFDGIITFGDGFIQNQAQPERAVNQVDLENSAMVFLHNWCEEYDVKPLYLILHLDEATPHFHFKTTAQNSAGKSISRNVNRKAEMRKAQDIAAESFKTLGFKRGTPKLEKVADAAEDLGLGKDKNGNFPPEAWKAANVVNRSVKQLHEDLPIDIQKLRSQVLLMEEKAAKNRNLAIKSTQKLRKSKNDERKLKKRIEAYERRENEARNRIQKLMQEIERIEAEITKKAKVFDVTNEAIKEALDESDPLWEAYKKEVYKHRLAFGVAPSSLSEMEIFIKWHDQSTGWTAFKNGVNAKQLKDPKPLNLVTVKGGNEKEQARTLLYVADNSDLKHAGALFFRGDDKVLVELYKANMARSEPFKIDLTEAQQKVIDDFLQKTDDAATLTFNLFNK